MSEKATQGYKSRVEYAVTDASQTTYSFPFQYLKKKFVKVQKRDSNKAVTEFTYGGDYTVTDLSITLTGTKTLAVSDTLIIYRETDTTGVVTWTDAGILLSKDMSLEQLQNLHLIEESQDYLAANAMAATEDENNITVWDALGQRITNVADPVDAQDTVTKHYMESVQDGFVQRNQAIETHVQEMQTDVTNKQQAAATSEQKAKTSETNAKASEVAAKASEEAAAASEQAAAESEGNAAASESNAKASETKAKTSETNAKTSETNAKASETKAKTSEQNAAESKSKAKTSETNAANSELMAQKWAESPTSPDGLDDTQSNTGKTQSAKQWALQAKNEATSFQDFVGATANTDGYAGRVPAPKAGDQGKFLSGDGSWEVARMTDLEIVKITNPVGTIRAFNNTFDPNTTWAGTTWQRFGQGRVLVGAGQDGGTNFTLGSKGGEEKHTLSVGEMPSHEHGATVTAAGNHSHTFTVKDSDGFSGWDARSTNQKTDVTIKTASTSNAGSHTHGITVSNTGGGGSHNNLQPYIVVNYWVRTA